MVGLSSVVACCLTSAFASVYFEHLLKQSSSGEKVSLWIKNVQIYTFGSAVAGVILLIKDWRQIIDKVSLQALI